MLETIFANWWAWMALGLCLIALEMVSATFLSLLVGISAILVGLVFFVFPELTVSNLFLIWGALSLLSVGAWFRFFKAPASRVSLSDSELDAVQGIDGTVILSNKGRQDGRVRFTVPVLDKTEWPFFSEAPLQEGDRVSIVGFKQNHFIVEAK